MRNFFLFLSLITGMVHAQVQPLMTGKDLESRDSSSGITIHNNTAGTLSPTGIYLNAIKFGGSACGSGTNSAIDADTQSIAQFSPGSLAASGDVIVGKNYLFNLIFKGVFHIAQNDRAVTNASLITCIDLAVTTTTPGNWHKTLVQAGTSGNEAITCSNLTQQCSADTPFTINLN